MESFSSNKNTQTLDLIEILPSYTPDMPIPNASINDGDIMLN